MILDEHGYYMFWSGESYMSNFRAATFNLWGVTWPHSEAAYMAAKAYEFNDWDSYNKICAECNGEADPLTIKRLGRKVVGYNEERWAVVRYELMKEICLAKFTQNLDALKELINTKDSIIVEAIPYDKVWGVGISINDRLILDPKNWKGQNLLGKVLMEVRDEVVKVLTRT